MRIPTDKARRLSWVIQTINDCAISRLRRQEQYASRDRWYTYGTSEGVAESNKIKPEIDTLSAFLYTGETTRFAAEIPPGSDPEEVRRAPAGASKTTEIWKDRNLDTLFGLGVTWACVRCTMFLKLVPRHNDLAGFLVSPGSMGVLREDVMGLDRQEAFTHQYWITKTELYSRIEKKPNRKELIELLSTSNPQAQLPDAGPLRAIATAVPLGYSGTITGEVESQDVEDDYLPQVRAPMVRVIELVCKNDATDDWHQFNVADPGIILYDGPGAFLPQEHNYVQITPEPTPDYFWGMSQVVNMKRLAAWRNRNITNIQNIEDQQFNPPKAFMGFEMTDEMEFALSSPGASVSSRNPNSKVQDFRPPMPEDVFAVQNGIDSNFDDLTGLQQVLQGRGGGKDKGHASLLAALGSARLRRMSNFVEDSLDVAATKVYKVLRAFYTDTIDMEGETPGSVEHFAPNELPDDAKIHVDSHTQSPIFTGEAQELAENLLNAKAIKRSRYLEMLAPPQLETLLSELKEIEKEEAAAAQQQLELEKLKAAGSHHK